MGRLLKVSQVAKRLKVSEKTIRRWIKLGKIKAVKYPSGQYRVFSREIESFLLK